MEREIEIEGNETLEAAVDGAAHGETVVLTRHGRPVATVVARKEPRVLTAQQANEHLEQIKRMRKGQRLGPDLTIKDLINEGRR